MESTEVHTPDGVRFAVYLTPAEAVELLADIDPSEITATHTATELRRDITEFVRRNH